jgi:hypothetical protein
MTESTLSAALEAYAAMMRGWLDEDDFPGGPCVVLAQGHKDNLIAVVLADLDGTMIQGLTLCVVPSPLSAHRTGKYPK